MKHPVDEILPIPKLAVYGFQHVMAFYAGAVIVPILLANSIGLTTEQLIHLINADLFTCGIASIIQARGFWKVGVRLPLLQGVTFTAVSPMIAIGMAVLPVAAADAVGGADNAQPGNPRNLAYALGTLAVIIVIQRVFRGFMA